MVMCEDINLINRFIEPPKIGIFCDIIWADPVENDDGVCEGAFRINETRGCSYFYGQEAVTGFLERNNLISVIRAHEAQLEGYKMHRWSGGQEFPMVITIFSAPNYCDVYNNKGAVIKFDV
jgi:serine/threonine-protein phosphatase 2B catalytic subunit